jgi:hypothetical protein
MPERGMFASETKGPRRVSRAQVIRRLCGWMRINPLLFLTTRRKRFKSDLGPMCVERFAEPRNAFAAPPAAYVVRSQFDFDLGLGWTCLISQRGRRDVSYELTIGFHVPLSSKTTDDLRALAGDA